MKQTPVAGRVAHVAEDHLDDVHGRAEVVGDVGGAPVDLRARRVPGLEDRVGSSGRSCSRGSCGNARSPCARGRGPLERRDQLLQVVGGQVDVLGDAALALQRPRARPRQRARDALDDLAVHLDEPAVGVAGEARALRRRRASPTTDSSLMPRLRIVSIMPGIEIAAPERTDTSSGSSGSPKRLPVFSSSAREMLLDLGARGRRAPPCRLHVRAPGVGRDREAGRNRHAERVISASPTPLPPRSSRPPSDASSKS